MAQVIHDKPPVRCLECRDEPTRRYSTGYGMGDYVEVATDCSFCRQHRDLHDDGECPPMNVFPVPDSPRPAA
jgi:hypothetical protein